MPIPIIAAVAAKFALPIVTKILGGTAIKGLLGSLGKMGIGNLLSAAGNIFDIGTKVMKQLGSAGLMGRPTPPAYGLVPGIRHQPPPGGLSRPSGGAAFSFQAKFDTMLGKFEIAFKASGRPLGDLQDRLLKVRDMVNTVGRFNQMIQDAMGQAYRMISA